MNEVVISVKNLSKVYQVYRHPSDIIKEAIFRKSYHKDFHALKNISFDVKKGEVVGIIGRNGSGKSTLLKIISGTLDKTAGSIKVKGKVSAILELGLGFNPEYTGRENIYNGGMILGMSKKEIDKKVDSIIKFSELENFIDQPYKTYSSGMQARLAFSVATSVNPEILIIDEALSAGDSFFVAKCMERINEMCNSGATVLFVSHALPTVQKLCNRAIYLDKGKMIKQGLAEDVCQAYDSSVMKDISQKLQDENEITYSSEKRVWKRGPIDFTKIEFLNKNNQECYSFYQNDYMKVRLHYQTTKKLENLSVWVLFIRSDWVFATGFYSCLPEYIELGPFENEGYVDIVWDKILLGEGEFLMSAGIYPYKKNRPLSSIPTDSLVYHQKGYKFKVRKRDWPLMTVYDQPAKVKHVYKNEQ